MKALRAALGGLTTRGRCLLSAGVTLLLCALVLGQRDLLRAAVFLVALPLCAIAVVARTRYRLTGTRQLDPARVEVGRPTTVRLQLRNVSRLPTGVLLVEDQLPYTLGGRPRFVLDRIPPGAGQEVAYPIEAETRGRYAVGPLTVRLTDPFGLCELPHAFTAVDDLIVTPALTPLPRVMLGGDWLSGGDASARSISSSGSDDIATREYRHGDDLRKVHWKSTARVGELMVRQAEQPFQSRATLLLDTRAGAHRGSGPASSFEWSVGAVASLGVALGHAGFALQLLRADGTSPTAPSAGLTEGVLLDTLAVLVADQQGSLDPVVTRLRRGGVGGVLIAVLGLVDLADAERLARLATGAGTCIALLLDADAWAPVSARARTAAERAHRDAGRLLSTAGWRVLPVGPGTSLADHWPTAAGRQAARR